MVFHKSNVKSHSPSASFIYFGGHFLKYNGLTLQTSYSIAILSFNGTAITSNRFHSSFTQGQVAGYFLEHTIWHKIFGCLARIREAIVILQNVLVGIAPALPKLRLRDTLLNTPSRQNIFGCLSYVRKAKIISQACPSWDRLINSVSHRYNIDTFAHSRPQ